MQHEFNKCGLEGLLGADCQEDDWLAPLREGFEATQLNAGAGVQPVSVSDFRRVQSTPAMSMGPREESGGAAVGSWGGSTAPLPIRPMRRMNPEDYSSLESSQSLLACGHGSYTDDNVYVSRTLASSANHAMLNRQGSIPQVSGTRVAPYQQHVYPHSMPAQTYGLQAPPMVPQDALLAEPAFPAPTMPPPPPLPGQGGHWAWIPSSGPTPAPSAALPAVAVHTGPVPLPVPMSTFDADMDMDLLDSIDILELADSLAPVGRPAPRQYVPKRAVGSCPLPALLEDALSAEDDGSDDTMQRANTSSPPLDGLDRLPSATYTTGSGGRSHSRSTHQGVPIPGARTAPLKVQRPSRSLSSPLLASELLASSCPSGDRPVRSAARRSMVVTAAALRDDEDYGSDSEISEEIFGGGSYNVHASLSGRRGGSLPGGGSMRFASASASGSKKKHNPWTMEETLALVEGVRLAGVGKWAEIKRLTVPGVANVLDTRSAVDLKDKWRNLTRVARLPKAALRARLQRGPSDVPLETMLLVKELMDTTGAEAE